MLWTGLGPIRRRHETWAARANARFENQAFQNQQISVQGAKGQLILFLLKEKPPDGWSSLSPLTVLTPSEPLLATVSCRTCFLVWITSDSPGTWCRLISGSYRPLAAAVTVISLRLSDCPSETWPSMRRRTIPEGRKELQNSRYSTCRLRFGTPAAPWVLSRASSMRLLDAGSLSTRAVRLQRTAKMSSPSARRSFPNGINGRVRGRPRVQTPTAPPRTSAPCAVPQWSRLRGPHGYRTSAAAESSPTFLTAAIMCRPGLRRLSIA